MVKIKVLFIGGTGVISTSVTEALLTDPNVELYLLNRGTKSINGAIHIECDISDKESLHKKLEGIKFDSVVQWIGYVPSHIKEDVEFFRDRTNQYVFISSASAYQKPPLNYLITEKSPLENPFWQYSRDKIACENILFEEFRSNSFPVTIVRPNYTYDKTMIPFVFNSSKRRYTIVDRIRKGKKIIIPGDGTNFFTLTHSRDFAKGFVGLLNEPEAIGQAFHITSDEAMTWDMVTNTIGSTISISPDIIHIPSDLISYISPDSMGGLKGDKANCAIFSNEKLKKIVPTFRATIPFKEGIKETIHWYESHPELCLIDDAFNTIYDKIIAQMEKAYGS